MKIGFDAKRLFHNTTGLGNYSRDLIRILSSFHPENDYFLYNPKPQKKKLFDIKSSSIIEKKPDSFLSKKLKSLWRTFGISSQLLKDKIDIYHGLSGEIPFFIPKKIKKIVTIHDLIFMRYPHLYSYWDRQIHFLKFKYAAKKCDKIIAISEQTKQDIVNYLKIDVQKIDVIYQGCASVFKEFIADSDLEIVRKKFNLSEKFLLNVGTIEPRKNALNIVKSIKNTDIPLILIGRKTKYYSKIDHFIDENKMTNVRHLSNVSPFELACIYRLATIFVYPSIFEGFGIPIIEALYSKTPVITNKSGVFPEAGGIQSVYIDPHSVENIHTSIINLWTNDEKRKSIAEDGFKFVQKFNDDIIAKSWDATYENILK
jgi:glycosyltransferase involved in cell wall biosynthesis